MNDDSKHPSSSATQSGGAADARPEARPRRQSEEERLRAIDREITSIVETAEREGLERLRRQEQYIQGRRNRQRPPLP